MAKKQLERLRTLIAPWFRTWQNRAKASSPSSTLTDTSNSGMSPSESETLNSESNPPDTPTDVPRRDRSWGWSLLLLSALAISGGTGAGALVWLFVAPPVPDCERIGNLASDRERLHCADRAAQAGDTEQIIAALKMVSQWRDDHPLQWQATLSMRQWTDKLMAIAREKMKQGKQDEAIALLRQVPEASPLYGQVQATLANWDGTWNQGRQIYEDAEAALKAQNWDKAAEKAEDLSELNDKYWRIEQFNQLMAKIESEQEAWKHLERARAAILWETAEEYQRAIGWARKVEPDSYAREEAQAEISRWSRALIEIAQQRREEGNFDRAIEVADMVPYDTYLNDESTDLITLIRVQERVEDTTGETANVPLFRQMLTYLDATAQLSRQIESDSPLYDEARSRIEQWQAHLQDLSQLKFARVLASVGQPPMLKLAIAQAKTVAPDRPRRIRAQTEIAHWRNQIQKIEDRPYLNRAQQLARPDTVEAYEAAIAEARKVELGRALRVEAQTKIANWQNQIEIVEDRPILAEARALAEDGSLGEAIDVAQQIEPGRALYDDAQAEIDRWWADIQIARDRPILNDARALAEQGRLTAAINTAASIGYGRPLYWEAQDAIARWAAEREAIYAAREAEAAAQQEYQPTWSPEAESEFAEPDASDAEIPDNGE